MVKNFIFLFLITPIFLFSGSFTATVKRTQVNVGEGFTLNLTLKEASAKGKPNIEVLKNNFVVHSQQQSSSTSIVNGKVSSSTSWILTLLPQKEGEVIIPSINIDTSEGVLSSQSITLQVVKGNDSAGNEAQEGNGITLTSDVSNNSPYKNQPFFYTVKLVTKQNLANIRVDKLEIEDAIVEENGQPKVSEQIQDGVSVGVIEFSYLITPLKAGAIKIPPVAIQGGIIMKRTASSRSFFDDDDIDPFSLMQGFKRVTPFAVRSQEKSVEIQAPVDNIVPWLPAKNLVIEEIWNESQTIQEGEPFTRSFKIIAEGIKSTQLPSVNNLGKDHFKVYNDKPELTDETINGVVKSSRKEQFTLIPQKSGTIVLPEISIVWWDVTKNEKMVSTIPPRTLQVLPAPEVAMVQEPDVKGEKAFTSQLQAVNIQRDPLLYAVIAGLSVLLVIAVVWIVILQIKINRMMSNSKSTMDKATKYAPKVTVKTKNNEKKNKLPELNPT